MGKYNESIYALNKFSENIVYKFADGIHEVTLEDYLKANPDKNEDDFKSLKAMSDEMFYDEDRADSRHGKKKLSLEYMKETDMVQTVTIDEELIHKQNGQVALQSAYELLEGKELTEIQRRRFILHYFKNVPAREIARREGVCHSSVLRALELARRKLKNIFEKF